MGLETAACVPQHWQRLAQQLLHWFLLAAPQDHLPELQEDLPPFLHVCAFFSLPSSLPCSSEKY